jgi:hypothetical protein
VLGCEKREAKWKELRGGEKERAQSSTGALGFADGAREGVREPTGKALGTDQLKSHEEQQAAMSDIGSAQSWFGTQVWHELGPENIWWPLSEKSKDGTDSRITVIDRIQQRQTGARGRALRRGVRDLERERINSGEREMRTATSRSTARQRRSEVTHRRASKRKKSESSNFAASQRNS